MNGKPTVISTFSGCGGSSLGYKLAGFEELLAIDFDENSVETFKLNFPEVPVWKRDLTTVKAEEIFDFCHIKKGELDILDGSPPCQGFSTTGKRQVTDSRNRLFENFVYLITELEPKVFVMENVSGQIKGKMKGMFKEIILTLKSLNYNVKAKLMNSKYYNVAQARERIFYIGVRKDLNIEPSYPIPSKNIINIRNAFDGLKDDPKTCIWLKPEWGTYKLWDKIIPGKSLAQSLNQTSGFSYIKVSPLKPSNTVTKTLSIGDKRWGALVHWNEKRTLSIEELKRICSFPDDFKTIGTVEEQWARLGNAVMPNMMKEIALNIKNNILKYE